MTRDVGHRSRLVERMDEVRAALSDIAYDVNDTGVRSLVNAAKDKLAMAQDLLEALGEDE